MAHPAHDEPEDFKEMELWEHLGELRSRLIRSVFYLVLGMVVAWWVYPTLWDLFAAPIQSVLTAKNWKFVYNNILQGFMLRLQVSLIAGLLIAIPLVTLEAWGFIAPGLTRKERKACYVVFPLALMFFFLGVVVGYCLMSVTVNYFAQYIPDNVDLLQDPGKYITFLVKMVVGFGICFEMPVLLMFLAWIGMVSSQFLKEQWRMAVVGCFVVAAIATPGGDPLTMMIMAAPLAILYIGSIGMVTMVEKVKQNRGEESLAP